MLIVGIRLALIIYIWMVSLVPVSPWRDSYLETAVQTAETVEVNEPLYRNDEARVKTAATLVALARFESAFNPAASGDNGKSHGLYQQQRFGDLREVREATRVALDQIRLSFRICGNRRDVKERLGWYAAGGNGCDNPRGLQQSRNRMNLAFQLTGE